MHENIFAQSLSHISSNRVSDNFWKPIKFLERDKIILLSLSIHTGSRIHIRKRQMYVLYKKHNGAIARICAWWNVLRGVTIFIKVEDQEYNFRIFHELYMYSISTMQFLQAYHLNIPAEKYIHALFQHTYALISRSVQVWTWKSWELTLSQATCVRKQ